MDLRAFAGRRRAITAVAAIAVAATGTAAASASAATLTFDKACYVYQGKQTPVVTYSGTGYGPGDPVALESSSGFGADTTADAAGNIAGTAPAPLPSLTSVKPKQFIVDAKDFTEAGTDATVATATSDVAAFGFFHGATKKAPGNRSLTEKVKWAFSGFPVGSAIYGHYLHRGKSVAGQKFGRAQGPCGTLVTHKRAYPGNPHYSSYSVQIDTHKKYSHKTTPRLAFPLALNAF